MEIVLAESAGFCFGVRRAIKLAMKSAETSKGRIFTLGPIIHNPQMVKKLEESGVLVVEKLNQLKSGDTVIIRSHGVTQEILKELEKVGVTIIDATCPFVKSAQQHVAELAEEDYKVVVVGEENHPEVIGIVSFSQNKAEVVNCDDKNIDRLYKYRKIGVVAQTTIREDQLELVVKKLLSHANELRIFNTICSTTAKRQEATRRLADRVDAMVVVGGYNSANTNRLASISRDMNKPTFHVETASELDLGKFNGFKKIGITAGASTPDWIIEEIIGKLENYNEEQKR